MFKTPSTFALIACFLVTSIARAQEANGLELEAGNIGESPKGWIIPIGGWKAELTEEKAAAGKRCVKLFKDDTDGAAAPFGNLMRSLPAADYAGRRVSLTARLLVVGEGQAQMWLRADLPEQQVGAFDNMGDRPIRAGDWTEAKIEADIETNAERLNIGFMSIAGSATIYIDDVKLAITGNRRPVQEPSPPQALSDRGAQNLIAAAKLLSYVRFFHPSDQAAGVASWDHFAVDLMERCEPAADAADLARRLKAAFAEIAPSVVIWTGPEAQAPAPAPQPSGATRAAMWRHYGAGTITTRNPQAPNLYQSVIEKHALGAVPGGLEAATCVKHLGGGVVCRIPIAVFADESGTLPHGKTPSTWGNASDLLQLSALNRSTRLAGVALAWGVFEHFFPYFDVVNTDWDAALPAALAKAAEDGDEIAYLGTLRELVAKLHDGHGQVMNAALPARSMLPLALEWAGNDLVVVGKHESVTSSVTIGDSVISIDGKPIAKCYDEIGKQIPAATDGWRRFMSCWLLTIDFPTHDPAKIKFRKPDGATVTVDLTRVKSPPPNTATNKRPEDGAELSPGIIYFDLNGADSDKLSKVMSKLTAAKAIIFDMRGYPASAAIDVIQHLIDSPAASARWCIPIIRRPDHENIEWDEAERWNLTPEKPRLTAKIAFVTDGRAISYAESIMGIVENYKLGEIIGATTAGTNGNVNPFTLPGGYRVYWTGMRVLKHDGSQHHGIGIAPTIPVTPTAKGISEGRDEVLEKAVQVMKEKIVAASTDSK